MDDIENLIEKADIVLSTEEETCTIVAKVRKFSNVSVHCANKGAPEFTDYDIDNDRFRYQYPVRVYANGFDSSNEGYISVVFTGCRVYAKNIEMTCVIAVTDAEESQRFLQSFTFTCDTSARPPGDEKNWPKFITDRYVSRSTLLAEPTEFLPDDTLTLRMDIRLVHHVEMHYTFDVNTSFVKSSFKTEESPDGPRHYLFLDSLVAERLREESIFFKRILVTPMVEKSSRHMEVPEDEYSSFVDIACLLLGGTSIQVQSLENIFCLYTVADKYDIGIAIDTCRSLLKSCLPLGYASRVLEFADIYNDESLKEIVRNFLRDEDKEAESVKTYSSPVNKEWTCEGVTRGARSHLSFTYQLTASEGKKDCTFDFYH